MLVKRPALDLSKQSSADDEDRTMMRRSAGPNLLFTESRVLFGLLKN
jgi:hypothetical protein